MSPSPVVDFRLGDVVRLRRTHPCGGATWIVNRVGADIGLRCTTCGRHVLIERRTVERRLAGFVERGDAAMTDAVAPGGGSTMAPAVRPSDGEPAPDGAAERGLARGPHGDNGSRSESSRRAGDGPRP